MASGDVSITCALGALGACARSPPSVLWTLCRRTGACGSMWAQLCVSALPASGTVSEHSTGATAAVMINVTERMHARRSSSSSDSEAERPARKQPRTSACPPMGAGCDPAPVALGQPRARAGVSDAVAAGAAARAPGLSTAGAAADGFGAGQAVPHGGPAGHAAGLPVPGSLGVPVGATGGCCTAAGGGGGQPAGCGPESAELQALDLPPGAEGAPHGQEARRREDACGAGCGSDGAGGGGSSRASSQTRSASGGVKE